jgi:2-haloacid dehalogenase
VFDGNETLSDMNPLRRRLEEVGAPGHLLDTWFAATLRDGFALTAAGEYADFAAVAKAALRVVLSRVAGMRRDVDDAASYILAGLPALEGCIRMSRTACACCTRRGCPW